jgi:hypothetical protein
MSVDYDVDGLCFNPRMRRISLSITESKKFTESQEDQKRY